MLTLESLATIRRLLRGGRSWATISARTQVPRATVADIARDQRGAGKRFARSELITLSQGRRCPDCRHLALRWDVTVDCCADCSQEVEK